MEQQQLLALVDQAAAGEDLLKHMIRQTPAIIG
jgi:hypothetical protein